MKNNLLNFFLRLGHRSYNSVYRQKNYYRATPLSSIRMKTLLGGSYENRALAIHKNNDQMVNQI